MMNIRELYETDLDDLLGLYRQLHLQDSPQPALAEVRKLWSGILGTAGLRYFGGFEHGVLVSTCTIAIIPNLTRSCRPYGLIENVVTHADYRRRGYGKALLQAALSHAWDNHCYKVMLMTTRLDAGTFSFYEAAGFSRHDKQAFVAKPH